MHGCGCAEPTTLLKASKLNSALSAHHNPEQQRAPKSYLQGALVKFGCKAPVNSDQYDKPHTWVPVPVWNGKHSCSAVATPSVNIKQIPRAHLGY